MQKLWALMGAAAVHVDSEGAAALSHGPILTWSPRRAVAGRAAEIRSRATLLPGSAILGA